MMNLKQENIELSDQIMADIYDSVRKLVITDQEVYVKPVPAEELLKTLSK